MYLSFEGFRINENLMDILKIIMIGDVQCLMSCSMLNQLQL